MKAIFTTLWCAAMIVFGVAIANIDTNSTRSNTLMAATTTPPQLSWAPSVNNTLPLDLRLSSEDRLSRETPKVKDSINIIDSVRWETKIRWKTRYKTVADRTAAREAGEHLTAVIPDSLPENPAIISTVGREEQPTDIVVVSKTPSIQLSVDGEVVYSTNDSHSAEEGQ